MTDQALMDAFDECLNRMRRGVSLEECLQKYPQHETRLRFLLLTSTVLEQQLASSPDNIQSAQDRVRWRVWRSTWQESGHGSRGRQLVRVVAILSIILFMGTLAYATNQSLPGEMLYPLKYQVNDFRVGLGQESDVNTQRLREINRILENGTVAEVEFQGEVQNINATVSSAEWQVADLTLVVPITTTIQGNYAVGSVVEITGYTTPQRQLIATRIQVLNTQHNKTATPSPTATPAPTVTSTTSPTNTEFINCQLKALSPNNTHIYAGGTTNHAMVADLALDTAYLVIGENIENGHWYAIYLEANAVGWVFSELVALSGNCAYLPLLKYPPIPQGTPSVINVNPNHTDNDEDNGHGNSENVEQDDGDNESGNGGNVEQSGDDDGSDDDDG